MVRVVGKEGALGAGVGGNCSSGMDGSKKITKRYPGRGKCLLLWWISILGGAFKREKARKKKKKCGLKTVDYMTFSVSIALFRKIERYASAVKSKTMVVCFPIQPNLALLYPANTRMCSLLWFY